MRQNRDIETYRAEWLRLRSRLEARAEASATGPEPRTDASDGEAPGEISVEGGDAGLEATEDEIGVSGGAELQHYGELMETAGDRIAPTADPGSTLPPEESTAPPSE